MRILIYNVERGGPGDRREGIEQTIADLAPDVAVICEAVGWRTKRVGEKILERMGGGEAFYCAARTGFDLAILTRKAARNPLRHPDLELFHGLLSLEVELGKGTWVRLHALHLSPTREEYRAKEVLNILEAVGAGDGLAELITGDFNGVRLCDTIDGMPVPDLPAGIGPIWRQDKLPAQAVDLLPQAGWLDLFREMHPGEPGYTFPSREPVIRYDYVFVNAAFRDRVTGIEVVKKREIRKLSDHLPILITLR